jgi:branched-chain amino acid transport system ATP-binding protein
MTVQPTESSVPSGGVPGTETSGPPVLELRDVAVHFGGVKAVDGITLKLEPGLIYGIIGPNGSGKTTLIGAITRLTQLTRGEMLFDGESITTVRPSRLVDLGVARTFQTVRLLPDLDVARNIQLGADARGGGGKAKGSEGREHPVARFKALLSGGSEPSPAVAAAIARTGLEGFERHYPTELSYGTQRRIEIARAMAMSPRLLLLDEPTAGMNQAERHEISALLRDMRSEGSLCQLLVEHDVQMMIDTCDYVFAMNTGRLIAEGEPQEVVQNPLVQEAYLGRKFREHA